MTHPHDFALLNDLLDGRMGWSATEELRRRLVEEPELGSAYDELVRLRAGLGALPRRAPPADFLAGVRARAGLAPAVEAAPASDSGVAGAAPISSREAPAGGGKVLRFPRRFLPLTAAAGLLVGLGAFALFGMRDRMPASAPTQSAGDRASPTTAPEEAMGYAAGSATEQKTGKKVGAPAKPGAPALSEGKGTEGRGAVPKPEALDANLPEGARPHYGAPGGAVAPGLRAPTDDPSGAAPPRPASGLSGAETAPARDGSSRAGVGGGGGGVAHTGELAADAATGAKAEAERSRPVGGPAEEKLRALESELAWARPGADEVLVVRAADFDGARADVALLLAAVRSGSSVEGRWKAAAPSGSDLLRESSESAQPALDDDAAKEDVPAGRGAGAQMPRGASAPMPRAPMPEDAKRKAASAPVPLGTFVVEVTEDEWTRLAGALGSGQDVSSEADSVDASAPAAPQIPATRPAPVVPPSAPPVAPPAAVPPAEPPSPTPTPAPPSAPAPEPAPLPDLPPPPAAGATPPTEAEAPAPSATGGVPRTEGSKDADKSPPVDRRSEPRRRVRIVVLPR